MERVSKFLVLVRLGMICLGGPSLGAAELPAGAVLEIRLLTSLSSHDDQRGDMVRGLTVVPVRGADGALLLPVGTVVQGKLERVRRVGLGLVHETASLRLQMNEILRPGESESMSITTRLIAVDNGRERVDRRGTIRGIRATASMAHRLHRRAWGLLMWHPLAGASATVAANVLFQFPEPEIQLPAGTELHARVERALTMEPAGESPNEPRELTTAEGKRLAAAVAGMPEWTNRPGGVRPVDPTNLVFVGKRESVERAFAAAGWHTAEPITGRTRLESVRAVAEARAYGDAPMSRMELGGRAPEMLRQRGLNTFAKRHHVRIWRQGETAEGEELWLGAATHDTSVCPTFKPLGFAHHIDAQVDLERQKVLHDLLLTGCVSTHGVVDRAVAGEERLAGRPEVKTDEAVVVVRLNECRMTPPAAVAEVELRGPNRATRVTRRVTLSARNYILRENLLFRAYDVGRVAWFLMGRAGKPRPEGLPQRRYATEERFAVPRALVSAGAAIQ